MKTCLVSVCLEILSCAGAYTQSTPAMVLFTDFETIPSYALMKSLQNETSALMAPIGIRLEWRRFPVSQEQRYAVELAVFTFKGLCDASALNPFPSNPKPLGLTHVSNGKILPFSVINCDSIRDFIQKDLTTESPPRRELLFGRAVVRVLAHELYHILANTNQHGHSGVAKASVIPSELLADRFHFDKRDLDALRKSRIIANLNNAANSSQSAQLHSRPDADPDN